MVWVVKVLLVLIMVVIILIEMMVVVIAVVVIVVIIVIVIVIITSIMIRHLLSKKYRGPHDNKVRGPCSHLYGKPTLCRIKRLLPPGGGPVFFISTSGLLL